MPRSSVIKPSHKALQLYYDALQTYSGQHVSHEGALETVFQRLLADTARLKSWALLSKLKCCGITCKSQCSSPAVLFGTAFGIVAPKLLSAWRGIHEPREVLSVKRGFPWVC